MKFGRFYTLFIILFFAAFAVVFNLSLIHI